jgi:hypothetical protein
MQRNPSFVLVAVLSAQCIMMASASYPTPAKAVEAIERIGVAEARMQAQ